jgi:hypothetical protein
MHYGRLKEAIKDKLIHYNRPDNLHKFISLAIKLDNYLYKGYKLANPMVTAGTTSIRRTPEA